MKRLLQMLLVVLMGVSLGGCWFDQLFGNIPSITPPANTGAVEPPAPETSVVQVPVQISSGAVGPLIDQQIPYPIAEDDGSTCNEYGVYPDRGHHTDVSAAGNTLTTRVHLVYRIKVYGGVKPVCGPSVSCGYGDEPARHADVVAVSRLTFDPAWHMDSATATHVETLDACNLSAFSIDVTSKIRDLANPRVAFVNGLIDSKVPVYTNIRPVADRTWGLLEAPIQVAPKVWLLVHPKTVAVSGLNGSGITETLSATLTAQPEIRVAGAAPPGDQTPLPPLAAALAGDAIHVLVDGNVSYNVATSAAKTALVGRQYALPGGHSVHITDVRAYGFGRSAILEVHVDGSVTGIIYFQGTPTYVTNPPNGPADAVTIPDLDYTLETKNVLAEAADWLLHPDFVSSLRAAAVFPVDPKLTDMRAQLAAALNRQVAAGVSTTGDITAMRILGVYGNSDGFLVRASADGHLRVSVSP